MAIITQSYLFKWNEIDAASDLDRLKLVLRAIPDEELMQDLEKQRGKGRDDYPVRAIWNSILAGVVFQHPTIASLRRELQRNGELRLLCGFDPRDGAKAIPTDTAYSRFLSNLLEREPLIREMFHKLVELVREHIPDLGRFLGFDGKALPSFAKKPGEEMEKQSKHKEEEKPDQRRENDADWGVKTYRGKKKDGTPWEKVVKWFGFELHLLVDTQHEIPLNYKGTKASASETKELLPIVDQTQKLHPKIIETATELSADKGLDSAENKKALWEQSKIKPIIDTRSMWPGDKTRPLNPDQVDTVVYDAQGRVSCVCPVSDENRPMVFWGFEADRETLKYRCPAAAYGLTCPGRDQCPGADTDYGKVVRVPIDLDRRLFTPLPRDSKRWKTAYARRTAVERVNSRIDQVLGFERHTIRGLKKMEARMGIALVVMLSMALGRIQVGQQDRMRSLVAPVTKAA